MAGSVVLFPLNDYPTGTQVIERNIPGQINTVTFSVRRCTTPDPTIWPNQSTGLAVGMEISRDGGATWEGLGGFTSIGGIFAGHDGSERTFSSATWSLLDPGAVRGRLTLTVTGGPLRSEGTLSWT